MGNFNFSLYKLYKLRDDFSGFSEKLWGNYLADDFPVKALEIGNPIRFEKLSYFKYFLIEREFIKISNCLEKILNQVLSKNIIIIF